MSHQEKGSSHFFGGEKHALSPQQVQSALEKALTSWTGKRILLVPPDFTRFHSRAGFLTETLWKILGERVKGVLPALGTHRPMKAEEIRRMFGTIPSSLFYVHDWKKDLERLGEIPEERVRELSGERVSQKWPIEINSLLSKGEFDLILSIGQIVPHEVVGMSGHTKNIFVGLGGEELIHNSHYLGALCGIERIIGQIYSPVRALLDECCRIASPRLPPIVYILSVLGNEKEGPPTLRALAIGEGNTCYNQAAELARKVNITFLKEAPEKIVISLDEAIYTSAWLGNKGIYRTRLAVADGGELILLAPGLARWGEDPGLDRMIRSFGYTGTSHLLSQVAKGTELTSHPSATAHLIHGSSEGRFRITYCPGNAMEKEEVEGVGFHYGSLPDAMRRYRPHNLTEGFHKCSKGEPFFYVPNPATGLWATKWRFPSSEREADHECQESREVLYHNNKP